MMRSLHRLTSCLVLPARRGETRPSKTMATSRRHRRTAAASSMLMLALCASASVRSVPMMSIGGTPATFPPLRPHMRFLAATASRLAPFASRQKATVFPSLDSRDAGAEPFHRTWKIAQQPARAARGTRQLVLGSLGMWLVAALLRGGLAMASGGYVPSGPRPNMKKQELVVRGILWGFLFLLAAILAGAETAITTLWPWKVKQLAAAETGSMFESLQKDVTKVLSTVLVGVTFCTVYGTALATDIAIHLFGEMGIGYATVALTLVTLFFGEILPKSLAVANAEGVARATLPLINVISVVFYPLGRVISMATQGLLSLLGVGHAGEEQTVTEPELRMMIMGAKQSGTVELYEQDMIEGVLDLDQSTVEQIMRPRVDVIGIDRNDSLLDLLDLTREWKYSRVPARKCAPLSTSVYNGTIDEINGIVFTRELIDYAALPREDLRKLPVSTIMEETAFVPESMSAMNALKLMRRQRLHMLVVVDEYGGTSGIITLEDILETLVGKIYDEDDDEEVQEEVQSIMQNEDGTWSLDGMAELEVACERLTLELPPDTMNEFSTISGFLCHQAGKIPEKGDILIVAHVRFEVLEADERRILSIVAQNIRDVPGGDASDSNVIATQNS